MSRYSAGSLLMVALAVSPANAQQPTTADLMKEIAALTQAVKALQQDINEIKAALPRPGQTPAPQTIVVDVGTNPTKGAASATLTLVEFTDYQCPFCARYVRDTYPQIEKEYIASGKVKYVMMDLPLESIHPHAFKAAVAANCAGEQGKYWEMHDRLFANQRTIDAWSEHATAVGLDIGRFNTCFGGTSQDAEIRRDMTQARVASITGTPGFIIAATEPGSSRLRALRILSGAKPFEAFKAQIDAILTERSQNNER